MAGPAYVNVGARVNAGKEFSEAVNKVGDIYSSYVNDNRLADELDKKLVADDEIRAKQEHSRTYKDKMGVGGRGLTQNAKKVFDQEERKLIESYQARYENGEEIPDLEKIGQEMSANRNRLVNREDARQLIRSDFLSAGYSGAEADAEAVIRASKYGSSADMASGEASRVLAMNERRENDREWAYKGAELEVDAQTKGTRSSTTSTAPSSYLSKSNLGSRTALFEVMKEKVGNGFLIDGDATDIMNMSDEAFQNINMDRADKNLPPYPYALVENFLLSKNKTTAGLDLDSMYSDSESMQVGMETEWKNLSDNSPYKSRGGANISQDYTNRMNNSSVVVARPMEELEVIKIKKMFSRFATNTPEAPSTSTSSSNTPKSGMSTQVANNLSDRAAIAERKRLATKEETNVRNEEVLTPDQIFKKEKNTRIDKLAVQASQTNFRLKEELKTANKALKDAGKGTSYSAVGLAQAEVKRLENEIEVYEIDLNANKEALGQNEQLTNSSKGGRSLTNTRSRFDKTYEAYGAKRNKYTNSYKDGVKALDSTLSGLEASYAKLQSQVNTDGISPENAELLSARAITIEERIKANKSNPSREFTTYETELENKRIQEFGLEPAPAPTSNTASVVPRTVAEPSIPSSADLQSSRRITSPAANVATSIPPIAASNTVTQFSASGPTPEQWSDMRKNLAKELLPLSNSSSESDARDALLLGAPPEEIVRSMRGSINRDQIRAMRLELEKTGRLEKGINAPAGIGINNADNMSSKDRALAGRIANVVRLANLS
jgi:hypothetical protein